MMSSAPKWKDKLFDIAIYGKGPESTQVAVRGLYKSYSVVMIDPRAKEDDQFVFNPNFFQETTKQPGIPLYSLRHHTFKELEQLTEKFNFVRVPLRIDDDRFPIPEIKLVNTDSLRRNYCAPVETRTVVLCPEIPIKKFNLPSASRFEGSELFYKTNPLTKLSENPDRKNLKVAIVGEELDDEYYALALATDGIKVTLIHPGKNEKKTMFAKILEEEFGDNVKRLESTEVTAFNGKKKLSSLSTIHTETGKENLIEADFVFANLGELPAVVPGLVEWWNNKIKTVEGGVVFVDPATMMTSRKNVFALGAQTTTNANGVSAPVIDVERTFKEIEKILIKN